MTRLSPAAQRLILAGLTRVSRARISRRHQPLPPLGEAAHLTAVIRVGAKAVPTIEVDRGHYRYPPPTVHVTVTNLDGATVDPEVAVDRLASLRAGLAAPALGVEGLGCSPDTLFLRCVHDQHFDRLREAVVEAFGVPARGPGRGWLFDRLTFANVVRFNGPGQWATTPISRRTVIGRELEIVRTDRYLSDLGTTVLARLPL